MVKDSATCSRPTDSAVSSEPAERFAEIRKAHDELSDPIQQLHKLLFDVESVDSIDSIIVDLYARLRQRRIPTDLLLSLAKD